MTRRTALALLALSLLFLAATPSRAANRLARETSPYLLLHAENPVDWYPWGPEALERARREQKPIFLSVGYSTCYWCHVMEREVFRDPAIARQMNEGFVNIKVDREERPDLDDTYMVATQLLTGGGGWPNSVFLTPDLKPFYGGTYFGPKSQNGRPGFPEVLKKLQSSWLTDRSSVLSHAAKVHREMGRARAPVTNAVDALPDASHFDKLTRELTNAHDPEWGGFGDAPPKFPSPSALHVFLERQDSRPAVPLANTLDHMVRGGIFDQLGGGFHRYSTDRLWLVPHFEKMLYDNAFLIPILSQAGRRADNASWLTAARSCCEFVLRELTGPGGEFHAALDAGEPGEEGAYYVWNKAEIEQLLGKSDSLFLAPRLGFDGPPNFEGGRHVLHVPKPLSTGDASRAGLLAQRLLAARNLRPRPRADTKVLTDWNGMMIRALALASRDLAEPRYLAAATKAADRLLERAISPGQPLRHSWRDGKATIEAFLDDYSFFESGLLALAEVSGEKRWLEEAQRLAAEADRRLWDSTTRRYRFAAVAEDQLGIGHELFDGAMPSGTSWMARTLVELARLTGKSAYLDRAGELLEAHASLLARTPVAVSDLGVALHRYHAARKLTTAEDSSRKTAPARAEVWPVSVELTAFPTQIVAGASFRATVAVTIAGGWHISSNSGSGKAVQPTTVSMIPAGNPFSLEGIDAPPGREVLLAALQKPTSLYEEKVTFALHLRVARTAAAGRHRLALQLSCQPCSDTLCRPPLVLPVEAAIEVVTPDAR